MSCEAYCNGNSTHLVGSSLMIQVNISFINKGSSTCGILVPMQLPIWILVRDLCLTVGRFLSKIVLALCNLPKAMEAITEATSKPLRVLDLTLQDSERDLSVWYSFVFSMDLRLLMPNNRFVYGFLVGLVETWKRTIGKNGVKDKRRLVKE